MFSFRKVNEVGDYLSRMDGEEYCRSAISGYYYSLFGCARMYLIFVMGESDFGYGRDIHGRVCDRLRESEDITESLVGETLDELMQLRNLADYDWNNDDTIGNISYL